MELKKIFKDIKEDLFSKKGKIERDPFEGTNMTDEYRE